MMMSVPGESWTHTLCSQMWRRWFINLVFYSQMSAFFWFCALSPLSVRRWSQCLCCWLLCSILGMYILRLWQMPIQRSLLTRSFWREVSVTSAAYVRLAGIWVLSSCYKHGNGKAHMHVCSWGQCFLPFPASLIIQLIRVFRWPLTLERR